MPAPPKPFEGIHAWSEAQLERVVSLKQEGRHSIGDEYRSNVLRADGSFSSDLGLMTVPKERELQIAQMIGEHRWTFVLKADNVLVDVVPATEAAAAALLDDVQATSEADDDDHDEGEGAETLDPPPSSSPGGAEEPAAPIEPRIKPDDADEAQPYIPAEAPSIEEVPEEEAVPNNATAG